MNCKICLKESRIIFNATILGKYQIKYYQCSSCKFIQTETPYWLNEAYSDAISSLDIGLVGRNFNFAEKTASILSKNFHVNKRFLDYGGGYGLFVRIMRDKGFGFYRQDKYCNNIFAEYFDLENIEEADKGDFELLTTFEVFEHLENPLIEIENMFKHSSSILFSTVLQPDIPFKSADDWWYFAPETGQHIALYSKQSLDYIAKYFEKKIYSNGNTLHLLSPKELPKNVLMPTFYERLIAKLMRQKNQSLLQEDFSYIKNLKLNIKC